MFGNKAKKPYLGRLGIAGLAGVLGVLGILGRFRGLYGRFRGSVEQIGIEIRGEVYEKSKVKSQKSKVVELQERGGVLEFEKEVLERENRELREQLEAPLAPDIDLLPARVIGKGRYLFIDKGKKDGVRKGQALVSEEFFIGQVIETGIKTAKVRLITDTESKVPARTEKGAFGLLIGDNTRINSNLLESPVRLLLTKVVQGEKIKKADFVSTAGDEQIPGGILIGKIEKVLHPGDVYQEAVVEEGVDYERLLYVFVVVN